MPEKYIPPPARPAAATREDIAHEFHMWDGRAGAKIIGATDYPMPPAVGGKDAILRFELRGLPITVQCARWEKYEINLRCVFLTVQAMRLAEDRGMAETMRQAFAQLPAPAVEVDPYEVLGVLRGSDLEDIEAVWKSKARRLHPDTSSQDGEAMKALNVAMDRIRELLK